jgi:hypothetical protein
MAYSVQGAALGGIGRDTEAETLLKNSYRSLSDDQGAVPVAIEQALMRLVRYYEARNDSAQADEYQAIYQREFGG